MSYLKLILERRHCCDYSVDGQRGRSTNSLFCLRYIGRGEKRSSFFTSGQEKQTTAYSSPLSLQWRRGKTKRGETPQNDGSSLLRRKKKKRRNVIRATTSVKKKREINAIGGKGKGNSICRHKKNGKSSRRQKASPHLH